MLKSRDVEDLVNLYLHRPLAYLFVKLTHRTPLTPNGITLMSLAVGLTGAYFWWSDRSLAIGAVLLWASAILDGADGMMARAKNMFSQLGRALDGSVDMIVVGASTSAVLFKLSESLPLGQLAILSVIAVLTASFQFNLYDYYKDLFLRAQRQGLGEAESIEELLANAPDRSTPLYLRLAYHYTLIPHQKQQRRLIGLTNPRSHEERRRLVSDPSMQARYAERHRAAMRLWPYISMAPHSYLLCLSALLGHLEYYLWYRVVVANTIFVLALWLERRATHRMLEELAPKEALAA